MLDLSLVFDRSAARAPSYARLPGEIISMIAYRPTPPRPEELPHGGGQMVLVIPSFLKGDRNTRGLRRFLGRCGFRAVGWGLGVNWGPTPRILAGLERRLSDLCRQSGPVALVGISLGGLFARDLAHRRAADIRHVITVASPYRLPTASPLEPLIRLCARRYDLTIEPMRLRAALAVPSTAICTRDDGIVAWESCRDEADGGTIIELTGRHMTLGRNPAVLRAIVQRLAEPPDPRAPAPRGPVDGGPGLGDYA